MVDSDGLVFTNKSAFYSTLSLPVITACTVVIAHNLIFSVHTNG